MKRLFTNFIQWSKMMIKGLLFMLLGLILFLLSIHCFVQIVYLIGDLR